MIPSALQKLVFAYLVSMSLVLVGFAGREQLTEAHLADPLQGGPAKADSSTIHASVEIKELRPLIATERTQLSFGQLGPGQTDGTVVVTTSNGRYSTGGAILLGKSFCRAEFLISGQPNTVYAIQVTAPLAFHDERPDIMLGVTALAISDLRSYSSTAGSETTLGRLNHDGSDSVFVGGTLAVPTTALNGSYEGRVVLTVNY